MTGPLRLTAARVRAGVWEGVLSGSAEAPLVEALHEGAPVPGATVSPLPGGAWAVRVPVPAEAVADGVNVLVIRAGGDTVANVLLVAGAAVEGDLRAEVDLLRAELDLLKRAFRRHCAETAGT